MAVCKAHFYSRYVGSIPTTPAIKTKNSFTMTQKQTLKHFTKETPLKVSEQAFKDFNIEGSNSFDIERICRGMQTVDLYHFDSGEVVHDVNIKDLIAL